MHFNPHRSKSTPRKSGRLLAPFTAAISGFVFATVVVVTPPVHAAGFDFHQIATGAIRNFSINEGGQVAYSLIPSDIYRSELRLFDGSSSELLFSNEDAFSTGVYFDSRTSISLNDFGQVAFYGGEAVSGALVGGAYRISSGESPYKLVGNLTSDPLFNSMAFNNAGEFAWVQDGLLRFTDGITTRTIPVAASVGGYPDIAINDRGDAALSRSGGRVLVNGQWFESWGVQIYNEAFPAQFLTVISEEPGRQLSTYLSINNHANLSYSIWESEGANPLLGGPEIGMISASLGAATLLDTSGEYADFSHGLNYPTRTAINDWNQVAFIGHLDDGRQALGIINPGGEVTTLVTTGDIVDGHEVSAINAMSNSAINNDGQVVASLTFTDGPTALYLVSPSAGSTPGTPLLPDAYNFHGSWQIPSGGCGVAQRDGSVVRCFVDPDYAVGYHYGLDDETTAFTSVLVPAPLPGGDAEFTLSFNGMSFELASGEIFDFTAYVSGGVSEFAIDGISVSERLDPTNPEGFVVGLTYSFTDNPNFALLITPKTEFVSSVPEPSAWLMLLGGLVCLPGTRRIQTRS